jgi:hypothetical protein
MSKKVADLSLEELAAAGRAAGREELRKAEEAGLALPGYFGVNTVPEGDVPSIVVERVMGWRDPDGSIRPIKTIDDAVALKPTQPVHAGKRLPNELEVATYYLKAK